MGITQQIGASSIIKPGVCTSSTRPASPYEGQMIYTTDLDTLEIWNGTAWRIMGASTPTNGTVLQTVTGSTQTVTSSTSTTFIDSTITATITPKSTSSKILVSVAQHLYCSSANTEISILLVRGAITLQSFGSILLNTAGAITGTFSTLTLDSPATTSATTYKTQFRREAGTGTVYGSGVNGWTSTIILQEISA